MCTFLTIGTKGGAAIDHLIQADPLSEDLSCSDLVSEDSNCLRAPGQQRARSGALRILPPDMHKVRTFAEPGSVTSSLDFDDRVRIFLRPTDRCNPCATTLISTKECGTGTVESKQQTQPSMECNVHAKGKQAGFDRAISYSSLLLKTTACDRRHGLTWLNASTWCGDRTRRIQGAIGATHGP